MTDFSQTARDPTGDDLMQIALTMAERGLGLTAPNPSVGAVLWRPDLRQIVGRGTTQPGGRPHAEPVAIAAAGDLARGATMAVTLEPCSHTGRSPPCVNAILKAGVARVIVAIPDPDARVSGRGIAGLVAAGVDVVRPSANLADRAAWITRGHILRVTERRPFIRLKMAVGPEGSIAEGNSGTPTWVTSPAARASGHLLRAMA
ncbi:MAG: bifunctional diaminohydroxyphosphoribosylaminopyrimidine deaminase/5-amino-6-(5-phosphoribosylamino)uracil reductase RibD, partial [Pseudomonadota bacterium]